MGQYPSQDTERPFRHAARLPILSADEKVYGYRLLFRTDVRSTFPLGGLEGAGRGVIDMTSLVGLKTLCDSRLGFIPCTRDILLGQYLTLLSSMKVVAEIPETVPADAEVLEACRALKSAGYQIALAGFSADDPRSPLAGLADFISVDIKQTRLEDISRITERYGAGHTRLVASQVETRDDFKFAKAAGFQLFQGYFFRKPETVHARGALSNRTIFLRLLEVVSRPELDWVRLEDLIKKDAMLYYRLLRYLNSAIFGLRTEVRSVTHALTLLGENEIRRWCRLAGMLELSQDRPSDLALSALVRARFAELVGTRVKHGEVDLFQLGLMSLMDAILEIPMRMVLEGLEMDADSRTLLLENQGPLLPIYHLTLAVEAGRWPAVTKFCWRLGLEEEFVAQSYWRAMEWAQTLSAED